MNKALVDEHRRPAPEMLGGPEHPLEHLETRSARRPKRRASPLRQVDHDGRGFEQRDVAVDESRNRAARTEREIGRRAIFSYEQVHEFEFDVQIQVRDHC